MCNNLIRMDVIKCMWYFVIRDLIELPGPAAEAEADGGLHRHPALLQLPIVPPADQVLEKSSWQDIGQKGDLR